LTFDTIFNLGTTTTITSFTTNFFVRTSIDNFATTVGGPFTENQQLVSGGGAFTGRNVDLSALADITSPVEIRIYLYDDVHSNLRTARVDNVVLNGNVTAVPEPGSLVIWFVGLLGAFGFVVFRRRRR
jgi:MYXO-CTERM domain-containing protein